MKKITSILLLITTVLLLLSFTGCKKNDGVPEGMQLVIGGENDAFSFYAPEEWTVANLGTVGCAYVSKIDTTSMTFTEAKMPEGSVKEYFESEKSKFPYGIDVKVNGESCSFGNASKLALKYVYTYTYDGTSFTCMQIFVVENNRFYIFTYTANNNERDAEHTYYEYYLEKVNSSIEAFTFNKKDPIKGEDPAYERDSDGYLLVSDKKLSGFSMYVPDSYKVDYTSGFVSVSRDGVNITMSEMTYPANSQKEYWDKRFSDLEMIVDKIPVDKEGESVTSLKVKTEEPVKIDAGNADAAFACEYSYILEGTEYSVYQVLLRKGSFGGKIYVYTYTATTDCYDTFLSEMKTIFGKIEF